MTNQKHLFEEQLKETDCPLDTINDSTLSKNIRMGYTSLFEILKVNKTKIITEEQDSTLNEILTEADRLYLQVHKPIDSVLDSRLMITTADLEYERLKNVPVALNSFSHDDFIQILRSNFSKNTSSNIIGASPSNDETINWAEFGMKGFTFYKGAIVTRNHLLSLHSPLYLSKEIPEKSENEKKPRVTHSKVNNNTQIIPEKTIQNDLLVPQKETTDFVVEIFHKLSQLRAVSFYFFIIDPSSFPKTVENLFYISFLAKENRIKIYFPLNESRVPENLMLDVLEDPDLQPDPESSTSDYELSQQVIIEMTMEKWHYLIGKLQIKQSLI